MIDFFDEDFPLTKKQAEEEKRRLNEELHSNAAAEPEMAVNNNEDDLQGSGNPFAAVGAAAKPSADGNCIGKTINETACDAESNSLAEAEQAQHEGESIFSFSFPLPENAGEYEPERSLTGFAEINHDIGGSDVTDPQPLEDGTAQNSRGDESIQSDYSVPQIIAAEAAADRPENDLPTEQIADSCSAAEIGIILSDQAVFSASSNGYDNLSAEPAEDTFLPAADTAENLTAENDGGADISAETEDVRPASDIGQSSTEEEIIEFLTDCEPENISEPGEIESEEAVVHFDEENALPTVQQEDNGLTAESAFVAAKDEPCTEQQKTLTHSEISAEIEEAVSSAINLHIETFIRGFKPTEGEADRALREELSRLSKKLDNVEKAVGAVEVPLADESDSQGFTYEYDERYFAEEETPAYKYPGLYKKNTARTREKPAASPKRPADKALKPQSFDKSAGNITVNTKTLLKMGAMVAATAAAVKLLGKKND